MFKNSSSVHTSWCLSPMIWTCSLVPVISPWGRVRGTETSMPWGSVSKDWWPSWSTNSLHCVPSVMLAGCHMGNYCQEQTLQMWLAAGSISPLLDFHMLLHPSQTAFLSQLLIGLCSVLMMLETVSFLCTTDFEQLLPFSPFLLLVFAPPSPPILSPPLPECLLCFQWHICDTHTHIWVNVFDSYKSSRPHKWERRYAILAFCTWLALSSMIISRYFSFPASNAIHFLSGAEYDFSVYAPHFFFD